VLAHELGCGHAPCYAVAQRFYPGHAAAGVNEYVSLFNGRRLSDLDDHTHGGRALTLQTGP
jgi:hypothetical protein